MSKWIKVEDRLPSDKREVLIYLKAGAIRVGVYSRHTLNWSRESQIGIVFTKPTHWRHMVMPPKKEEKPK